MIIKKIKRKLTREEQIKICWVILVNHTYFQYTPVNVVHIKI